jgi:hypothetical protein
MNTVWILLWLVLVPESGVRYYHLGTYDNETLCKVGLRDAAVMVNDTNETVQCIGVQVDD